jgi:hypothetical protein
VNELLQARIWDAKGSLVRTYQSRANGYQQKMIIDLAGTSSGVYLLEVNAGGQRRVFKLYRE